MSKTKKWFINDYGMQPKPEPCVNYADHSAAMAAKDAEIAELQARVRGLEQRGEWELQNRVRLIDEQTATIRAELARVKDELDMMKRERDIACNLDSEKARIAREALETASVRTSGEDAPNVYHVLVDALRRIVGGRRMTYKIITINLLESPLRFEEYRHDTEMIVDCVPIVGTIWGQSCIWPAPEYTREKKLELIDKILEKIADEQTRQETIKRELEELREAL